MSKKMHTICFAFWWHSNHQQRSRSVKWYQMTEVNCAYINMVDMKDSGRIFPHKKCLDGQTGGKDKHASPHRSICYSYICQFKPVSILSLLNIIIWKLISQSCQQSVDMTEFLAICLIWQNCWHFFPVTELLTICWYDRFFINLFGSHACKHSYLKKKLHSHVSKVPSPKEISLEPDITSLNVNIVLVRC